MGNVRRENRKKEELKKRAKERQKKTIDEREVIYSPIYLYIYLFSH